jgi:hypothetical protein
MKYHKCRKNKLKRNRKMRVGRPGGYIDAIEKIQNILKEVNHEPDREMGDVPKQTSPFTESLP